MTTKIVAIDGGGGAGKSTLAERLAALLAQAQIIHADDFMSGPDSSPDWWKRLQEQVLIPLSEGRPAHYQRFDWDANQLAEWHDVPLADAVILEGVTSLRTEFRPYLAYGIWVETPKEERLRRGLARDGQQMREKWLEWMAWDQQYLDRDRPDTFANIVVNGNISIKVD